MITSTAMAIIFGVLGIFLLIYTGTEHVWWRATMLWLTAIASFAVALWLFSRGGTL